MPENALLRAHNIDLTLAGRQILQQVSLSVSRLQTVTLIGPNGAGKTTLVRVLLGLLRADSGELWRARGLRIGYMPQKLHIEATLPLTVERFLQLPQRPPVAELERVLGEVRIKHLRHQALQNLSGGETQRALLARALLRSPDLLVLDEPAQGVDVGGQIELYQLINRIREQHRCGVLMISHDLHRVMATTDEVICLNQHVCCHGKPEQVSHDPAYLALFGPQEAGALAVYTHHHNHHHDIHGNIVDKESSQ